MKKYFYENIKLVNICGKWSAVYITGGDAITLYSGGCYSKTFAREIAKKQVDALNIENAQKIIRQYLELKKTGAVMPQLEKDAKRAGAYLRKRGFC